MNTEFIRAINELEKGRGIPSEVIMEAIEAAIVSAYKKNYGTAQNVRIDIDRETGEVKALMRMEIVEEIQDEMTEMSLAEAKEIDPRYEVGDFIEFEVMPKDFGRIAANTAKQVVIQKIREAERNMIYEEFSARKGEIVTGRLQRRRRDTMFINIGKTEGILSRKEQVRGEHYEIGDRVRAYIMDVKYSAREPQIFLSRSHPGLVKCMFEEEVPEIQDGIVVIKGVAREAGSRTKIAVYTEYDDIDPVGSCVGPRGSRVQSIVDELHGEKIDIIPWSEDPVQLIANVLSPAQVEGIITDEEEKSATAIVPDFQLSLAIGKEGQNVRLAAKVSGWKIDIKSHTQYYGDEEADLLDELSEEINNTTRTEEDDVSGQTEADEGVEDRASDEKNSIVNPEMEEVNVSESVGTVEPTACEIDNSEEDADKDEVGVNTAETDDEDDSE